MRCKNNKLHIRGEVGEAFQWITAGGSL